jgi:lipopolysaccharide/colanic/teichoic acid biosynthesis glycosyltransferase
VEGGEIKLSRPEGGDRENTRGSGKPQRTSKPVREIIGQFLRRTSLDELPQLFNVIRGEMSLVGPRPVIRTELSKYGDDVDYFLMVRPGMTGLWQVSGRNDVDYDTRVYLDTWYVKNWSLWYDIAILFKTIKVVLRRDGAY